MNFIKKQSLGSIFSLLTLVFAIVGMILYNANSKGGYYNDYKSSVIIYTIIAIVVALVPVILERIMGENQLLDLFYVAVPVLLALAMVTFLGMRVYSYAIILGSDLESGNVEAMSAMTQSFYGIGSYALAMVSGMVTCFLRQVKPEAKAAKA